MKLWVKIFNGQLKAISLIFILLIISFSCKEAPDYHNMHESNKPFFYSKKFDAIYINHCDIVELPDSITSKDVRHLLIKCPKLINYNALFKQLNKKNIFTIRIDDLNSSKVNLDFRGFESLKTVTITGTEKLNQIKFTNLEDKLNNLRLFAPNLEFPVYNPSFSRLESLHYNGRANKIPKWIESLDSLRELHFESGNLEAIESDVCKMKNIHLFDIVGSEPDKEEYLKSTKVYPTLQKFKECKPDLSFIYILPGAHSN
jgi:hypothetical protein